MSDWPFDHLIPLSHDVIVADPPWAFETYSEIGQGKGAANHYETMSTTEICRLPVGQLARGDCVLLLWATSPMLKDAFDVMDAWGFSYKSQMIWRKTTKKHKVRVATGYWCRSMHEPILLGVIGKPKKFSAFPSMFDGIAREHSRKPEEFFTLVEKHLPSVHRLELFSRQSRPGWSNWGFERNKFDEAAE